MRRISLAFALAALLLPAVAHANEHRMRVSEILLSEGGDDAAQYIELSDAFVEMFPNNYYLGVYDADGQPLGTVSFNPPNGPTTFLISTPEADTAFGVEGDAELTVALPAAGQVCFEKQPSSRINCTSWGCINTRLTGFGALSGEAGAPPDGVSAQVQGNGTYQFADPTPGVANQAGEAAASCASDPDAGPSEIDAGTGGDADAGPGNPDGGGSSGDGGDGDDDSGCGCGVNADGRGMATLAFLALALLPFRRRRRS